MYKHGTMKQDVGPYAKGSVVSTDPRAEEPAVFVDPARFEAWEKGGFLKSVRKDKPTDQPPGTPREQPREEEAPEDIREKAAAFVEAVTGEAVEADQATMGEPPRHEPSAQTYADEPKEEADARTWSDKPEEEDELPSDELEYGEALAANAEKEEPHG